jgi:hypothetical protein
MGLAIVFPGVIIVYEFHANAFRAAFEAGERYSAHELAIVLLDYRL